MIFRISVSDWESYSPKDYLHPTKTKEEFEADVSLILEKYQINPEELTFEYDSPSRGHIIGHELVDGYKLQNFLDEGLKEIGYMEDEISEVCLRGGCSYLWKKDFPEGLMSWSLMKKILKWNLKAWKERW